MGNSELGIDISCDGNGPDNVGPVHAADSEINGLVVGSVDDICDMAHMSAKNVSNAMHSISETGSQKVPVQTGRPAPFLNFHNQPTRSLVELNRTANQYKMPPASP